MRPPEFTGGNVGVFVVVNRLNKRFNEAAGIHRRKPWHTYTLARHPEASMRPPEFTGGNVLPYNGTTLAIGGASMRPPEFTGGNQDEAARRCARENASMRPPEFTGGNTMGSAYLGTY